MFKDYTKYEVYEDGRIWSYSKKKFLKPFTRKDGYQQVWLTDNEGNAKIYFVHRVVWESVTGAPIPKGMQINHRNEIKTSNMISNLELVSPKENCNWQTRNERISKSMTNGKLSKQVGAYKDGNLVMTFSSTNEARRNGFDQGAVAACCRCERKTHKGFEWRYI